MWEKRGGESEHRHPLTAVMGQRMRGQWMGPARKFSTEATSPERIDPEIS